MHDVKAMVGGAFRGLLEDVAAEYRHMAAMSQAARDTYIHTLRSDTREIQTKINGPEVQNAKLTLLKFQYASRVVNVLSETSNTNFDDSYTWEKQKEGKEILSWRWSAPSEERFLQVMLSWASSVDFYTQVNEICRETFGLPIPGTGEAFEQYTKRANLAEESWSWRYDGEIKQERHRFLTSQRRLGEIEQRRAKHRAKSAACMTYLAEFYAWVRPSSDMLQNLKRSELGLATRVDAAERAHQALREGVQLKHLLLEEGAIADRAYSEISRWL